MITTENIIDSQNNGTGIITSDTNIIYGDGRHYSMMVIVPTNGELVFEVSNGSGFITIFKAVEHRIVTNQVFELGKEYQFRVLSNPTNDNLKVKIL